MKNLNLNQMETIEAGAGGGPEFIILCGILSAGLGLITFGLGALAGVGCWVLGNDVHA